MRESDNYAPGSYNDPSAPWNDPGEQDPVDVDVCVSYSLSKPMTVGVTNYALDSWEDYESDGEGGYCHFGGTDYDFSNTNFTEEYNKDDSLYGIPELLNECKRLAEEKLQVLLRRAEVSSNGKTKNLNLRSEINNLKSIIQGCEGWTTDDLEVVRDD